MKRTKFFNKVASFVLAFAMILLAIPTMEAKAAQNVTVHFKNTEGWSKVCAYSWNTSGELLGIWPGTDITATANGDYYTATLENYEGDSVNIIFGDGGSVQTLDLTCDLTKGNEWWVVPSDNSTGKWGCVVATSQKDAEGGKTEVTTPTGPTIPENPTVKQSPVIDGNRVTFYMECENASKVEVFGSMNSWSGGYEMEKDGNVYSYTMTLDAGSYQYKYVVDGGTWITDPFNPTLVDDGTGNMNSGFEVTATGTTTPENPTVTVSPVVDGNKVVFYYESSTASKVEVFGSMNEWASGFEMTKDGNVFSYTCELDAGTYQYKFVVDGEWIIDPVNSNTAEDGLGGLNSSFEVKATATTPEPQPSESEESNTEADKNDTEANDTEVKDTEKAPSTDASANAAPLSDGVIILISAIVTIVVVLGGFAVYMYVIKKKQA
ncbi:MAG: starch-binding protein [Agathobacter sp.]|nr:starch-binding protein [Agathobacter sp.]